MESAARELLAQDLNSKCVDETRLGMIGLMIGSGTEGIQLCSGIGWVSVLVPLLSGAGLACVWQARVDGAITRRQGQSTCMAVC